MAGTPDKLRFIRMNDVVAQYTIAHGESALPTEKIANETERESVRIDQTEKFSILVHDAFGSTLARNE